MLENTTGYKEICIFRDININSLNHKVTSIECYLNQIHGLTNLIRVLTRVNNLGETLIDQFYCSSTEKVTSSYVFLSYISDYKYLFISWIL